MDSGDSEQLRDVRQENIGRLCLRLYRGFNAEAVTMLQARGHAALTLAHTALLINLDVEGTRIVDLAGRAGMSKQAMGRLVHHLEQVGYVKRAVDPGDRRATLVTFTPDGRAFLRDAAIVKRDIEADYAALLGDDGFSELRDQLLTLVNRVERDDSPMRHHSDLDVDADPSEHLHGVGERVRGSPGED